MLRAFWTWNPVSSVTHRPFDEPYAYRNNGWLFDREVWTSTFRAMSDAGFNAMILANTHPFPFMVNLADFPQAKVIDDTRLADYIAAYHWIFREARARGIAPYVLFFSIYYPDPLLAHLGITAQESQQGTGFSIDYTNYCVRLLLREYPELAGIVGDASENIDADQRETFLQGAVVDAVDEERPDIHLMMRGYWSDPAKMTGQLKRRNGKPITWTNKYTFEHLVHTDPDPVFKSWVKSAGAENVAGEFWISNFEPWSCFSFESIEGIVANLEKLGCAGFSVHPLSMYQWPFCSDTAFRYQWERDIDFYRAWGSTATLQDRLLSRPDLADGFAAASRVMERLALYIAGDRENQWHPQFCSIKDYNRKPPHLLTIEDMLNSDDMKVFQLGKNWWQNVTGQRVVHFAEYVESGTPAGAFGPEEFIEELGALSSEALAAAGSALSEAAGDDALRSLALDAQCMGLLGEFYVHRSRAAISRGSGDDAQAVRELGMALESYKQLAEADSQHRKPFRVLAGRATVIGDFRDTLSALEAEYTDAAAGEFKRGAGVYQIHKVEGGW